MASPINPRGHQERAISIGCHLPFHPCAMCIQGENNMNFTHLLNINNINHCEDQDIIMDINPFNRGGPGPDHGEEVPEAAITMVAERLQRIAARIDEELGHQTPPPSITATTNSTLCLVGACIGIVSLGAYLYLRQ